VIAGFEPASPPRERVSRPTENISHCEIVWRESNPRLHRTQVNTIDLSGLDPLNDGHVSYQLETQTTLQCNKPHGRQLVRHIDTIKARLKSLWCLNTLQLCFALFLDNLRLSNNVKGGHELTVYYHIVKVFTRANHRL
jgi:hypothetical protein